MAEKEIEHTETFTVTGMSCASCAMSAENIIKQQHGVVDAAVNYANASLQVKYMPEEITPDVMKRSLQGVGYDLIINEAENLQQHLKEKDQYRRLLFDTIGAALLSIPLIIIAMAFPEMPYAPFIMMVLATPVVFWFGRRFFINAWHQLKQRSVTMDTLVALSTGIAFLFSAVVAFFPQILSGYSGGHHQVYFESAAVIITFILIGRLLEERAKAKTSYALKKLIGLQPDTVTLIQKNGSEEVVLTTNVQIGDVILVRPGDRIAVDGTLTEGTSFVDESMISGEPIPVEKTKGDVVFSGTINQKGSFQFRADKVGGDTVLSRIIAMVQEAQGSKAPVQKLVDKVASIFVPVVMGIAVISFVGWMIWGGENAFTHALLALVTVLIVACPCALGLATPTAIIVGVGKGAENGILIRDAESLEQACKVDTLLLDKTGTITTGKPTVSSLVWKNGADIKHLENILYHIEKRSEHPVAEAVVQHLEKSIEKVSIPVSINSITGKGVKANIDHADYYVGNHALLREMNIVIDSTLAEVAAKGEKNAQTVFFFCDTVNALAVISVADQVKASSIQAIQLLQQKGISVHILTGDNEESARAIALQTGVEHFQANMLPQDKQDYVKRLQEAGKMVAMVGDGINDSQALAQADVSIAMGQGSDIAMDVAKMTIISSDLIKLPMALNISAQTVRTIHQNLFWAFIYNMIGIPIAAGILYPFFGFMLSPMIAGAAMALSSFSVVSNSLRLKWIKI